MKKILAASLLSLNIATCAMDSSSSPSSSSKSPQSARYKKPSLGASSISWNDLLAHPLSKIPFIFTLAEKEFAQEKEDAFKLIAQLTVRRFKHDSMVNSVAFHPNGTLFVAGCDDGKAYLYDLDSNKQICDFAHPNWVFSVAFNRDGTELASECCNRTVYIHNLNPQKKSEIRISPIKYDHNGSRLATEWYNKKTQIPDPDEYKQILQLPHVNSITSAAFNNEKTQVATTSDDTNARIFPVKKIYEIVHTMSLAQYHLLKAFQVAILSNRKIGADQEQWQTWESLQKILPEIAIQRLEQFIIDGSNQPTMKKRKIE